MGTNRLRLQPEGWGMAFKELPPMTRISKLTERELEDSLSRLSEAVEQLPRYSPHFHYTMQKSETGEWVKLEDVLALLTDDAPADCKCDRCGNFHPSAK